AEVVEADGGNTRALQFVVTLSEAAGTDVRVDYQTISGTAKEYEDFSALTQGGQLVIAAGQTSGVITVSVSGGSEIESDEWLALELTDVQGAVFAGDAPQLQAHGVILDTDGAGGKLALWVSDALVVEGDGGEREAVFEVRLSRPVDEPVTIHYTT